MKKVFVLPIMAMGLMVSMAWGAAWDACTADLGKDYYCEYRGPLSCWQLNKGETGNESCTKKKSDCIKDGFLYYGARKADEGKDKKCADIGGTWSGDGKNPNFNGGVPLFCQWASGCQPITDDDGLDNCKVNGSVYKNVSDSDIGANKECKNSGSWTGDGKNPNAVALGCCDWEGKGKCFKVFEESEWADCAGQYRYATCPGDEEGTCTGSPLAPSSSSARSSSSANNSPIISHNNTPVIGLNVVHFARSLRIASGKDATVSLFDISGKQVLSQRVLSGTTTISLEKQKLGVYYAVAKSGSQKQIVKIVLK